MAQIDLDAVVWKRLRPFLDRAVQTSLAEQVGVSQQRISKYKTRDWQRPSLTQLDRFARAFGLTLAEILADEEPSDPRPAWQRELYAAVAGLDEVSGTALLHLMQRAAPVAGAPPAPARGGQPRSRGTPTR